MKTTVKLRLLIPVIVFLNLTACIEKPAVKLPEGGSITMGRTELLFDDGWRFFRGDTTGAEKPHFNDSGWRSIDLPHDWSIEDMPGTDSPLDSTAVGGIDAGYFTGGTGWYRKSFFVPSSLSDKNFILRFDGIYMNADVWLNGIHLGNHPYGYTSFFYDISDYIKPGKKNVVAVKVRNEGRNSRWYSGSGIYRHVWLTITGPVHFPQWSIAVTSKVAGENKAEISINGKICNKGYLNDSFHLVIKIFDPSGKLAGGAEQKLTVQPETETGFNVGVTVENPELWSPETPSLYKVVAEINENSPGGTPLLLDQVTETLGIRTISVDARKGFVLNGTPLKMKGGCVHHDNGPLGAAAFDRAEERRVELLKAAGFNTIRCAHNPPSPAFLDACDRIGMLVIDEAFDIWKEAKNPDDYHLWFDEWWKKDIESMILRDRNHPSVVMWSIGNEVPERGKPEGAALAKEMAEYVRLLDPTRPVTAAVNTVTPDKDPYFAALDACGYNYAVDKYVSDHKRLPDRIMMGSESFPLEAFEYWMATIDNPWVIGDFVWTAFDYLGEASIGWRGYPHRGSFYPWHQAFCGDIDICGFKRPQSFYRDALWGEKANVSLFVKPPVPSFPINPEKASWSKWEWQDVVASWNWEGYEGKPLTVEVYSNCDEVELLLDGKSLGKKKMGRQSRYIAHWEVPYKPGTITARGFRAGKEVASSELKSAGKPEKINLTADRTELKATGQDLSYITVDLHDDAGIRNPKADNLVKFSVEGPGEILSAGSSNPVTTESYKKPYRKAYQGRCLVILKSGKEKGTIRLKAESEGLEPAEIFINVI